MIYARWLQRCHRVWLLSLTNEEHCDAQVLLGVQERNMCCIRRSFIDILWETVSVD